MARDGRRIPIEDSAAPIKDVAGNVAGVVLVFHDVTEKRRERNRLVQLNRTLKAHSRSDQALLHATDEASYLAEVCRIIVEDCGHAMVWVGFREYDESCSVRPAAYSGFEEGYLETLGSHLGRYRARPRTYRHGHSYRDRVHVPQHAARDPAFLPWREQAMKRGYASSIVLPLMDNGRHSEPLPFILANRTRSRRDEVKLLTEIAGDLAYGLTVLRLRADHMQAEHILRESESRLRTLAITCPRLYCSGTATTRTGNHFLAFLSAASRRLPTSPLPNSWPMPGLFRNRSLLKNTIDWPLR